VTGRRAGAVPPGMITITSLTNQKHVGWSTSPQRVLPAPSRDDRPRDPVFSTGCCITRNEIPCAICVNLVLEYCRAFYGGEYETDIRVRLDDIRLLSDGVRLQRL